MVRDIPGPCWGTLPHRVQTTALRFLPDVVKRRLVVRPTPHTAGTLPHCLCSTALRFLPDAAKWRLLVRPTLRTLLHAGTPLQAGAPQQGTRAAGAGMGATVLTAKSLLPWSSS